MLSCRYGHQSLPTVRTVKYGKKKKKKSSYFHLFNDSIFKIWGNQCVSHPNKPQAGCIQKFTLITYKYEKNTNILKNYNSQ